MFQVRDSLITWVRAVLPAGKPILELGSGAGTTAHLGPDYELHSVEHDPRWLGRYRSHYIPAPPLWDNWYDPNLLQALLPTTYDLLIVDGPPRECRVNFIRHFTLFKRDVPIVIDDAERAGEQAILQFLAHLNYVEIAGDRSEATKQWVALRPPA